MTGAAAPNTIPWPPILYAGSAAAAVVAGLLAPAVLFTALTLLPVVFAGLWVGGRMHARVTREQIIRGVCILLVASGASLLVRALGQV